MVGISIARRLEADIQSATLKTISNCGHSLTEDQPGEVTRLLSEFLGGC